MIRKVTATIHPTKAGLAVLTMAPANGPTYQLEREIFRGDALRTLKRWKVAKPDAVLFDCVRTGTGSATC